MAFKVNQRVRCIAQDRDTIILHGNRIGQEGTVVCTTTSYMPDTCRVVFDGSDNREWICGNYQLVPAVDPSADAWAEGKLRELERLVREPKPMTDKQLEEVRGA